MSDFDEVKAAVVKFTQDRDWDQFHNPKDLAIALNIESSELLECFLWKNCTDYNKEKVVEELADVLNYAFLLADKLDVDVKQIILDKMEKNAIKYPVDKAKGVATKYTDL